MLRDNLYILKEISVTEFYEARVGIIPESGIYSAHFPGMPVTPGACLVQMACELASLLAGKDLVLSGAGDIRFLRPVLPSETKELSVRLESEMPAGLSPEWKVLIFDGENVFARMRLSLQPAE